jgi:GNAT superfamily N-acetyltransferase
MEILQARPSDLIEILYLLKVCVLDMNQKGLKHWNNTCPGSARIQKDLTGGLIYLAKEKGVCKGMITLSDQEPEDYKQIGFKPGAEKPLYLQHLAVHPRWQGKGIARLLIEFAQQAAKERGFDAVRLDVFKTSETARQFCMKQSFMEVAPFHTAYQQIPYLCYEKKL